MAANIPEDLQPPSKRFLATPLELHTNEIKIFLKAQKKAKKKYHSEKISKLKHDAKKQEAL